MNIAVIDDIRQDREQIKSKVMAWLKESQISADIQIFESSEAFFAAYTPGKYAILLLDLYMNGNEMDGMEIARRVRQQGDDCQLAFITSSDAGAVFGYDVEAAGYLLKPVTAESLGRILSRCIQRLRALPKYIDVIVNRLNTRIYLKSILWINTYQNAVYFHTDGGVFKSYMTFERLNELLREDSRFLLCYKGCLVNMDRISSIDGDDFRMENGDLVQIRKRGARDVKRTYVEYLCGGTE